MKDKKGKNGKKGNATASMTDVEDVLSRVFELVKANAPDPNSDPKNRFLFPRGIDHLKAAIEIWNTKLMLELEGPDGATATTVARGGPLGVAIRLTPESRSNRRRRNRECGSDESEVPDLSGLDYPTAEAEAHAAGQFGLVDSDGNTYPPKKRTEEWFIAKHCANHPQPGDCHNTGGNLGVELERQSGG